MSGFAGTLRERVSLFASDAARDALGADAGGWTLVERAWAAVAPAGHDAPFAGDAADAQPVWRVTLRPCAVKVGDRIGWNGRTIAVREVLDDPRLPDRIVASGSEIR